MYLLAPASTISPFLLLPWFSPICLFLTYMVGWGSNQTEIVLAPKPPLSSECFLWKTACELSLSCGPTFVTPQAVALQAPLCPADSPGMNLEWLPIPWIFRPRD